MNLNMRDMRVKMLVELEGNLCTLETKKVL